MNKKIKKIFIILFIISILTSLFLIKQSKATTNKLEIQQVYQIADIDPSTYSPSNGGTVDVGFTTTYTGKFLSVLFVIAVIIAIIVIIIIGIKYMLGSAQERSEYKKNLMPVLLGIVIITFLTPILSAIASLSDSMQNENAVGGAQITPAKDPQKEEPEEEPQKEEPEEDPQKEEPEEDPQKEEPEEELITEWSQIIPDLYEFYGLYAASDTNLESPILAMYSDADAALVDVMNHAYQNPGSYIISYRSDSGQMTTKTVELP